MSSAVFRHRRKSQEDTEFDPSATNDNSESSPASSSSTKLHQCHICKKVKSWYGSDKYYLNKDIRYTPSLDFFSI